MLRARGRGLAHDAKEDAAPAATATKQPDADSTDAAAIVELASTIMLGGGTILTYWPTPKLKEINEQLRVGLPAVEANQRMIVERAITRTQEALARRAGTVR